jgi:hypothetical protein
MPMSALTSAVAILVIGCTHVALASSTSELHPTPRDNPPASQPDLSDDDAVREVITRRFFGKSKDAKAIIFVDVGDGGDPSDRLLKRLSDLRVSLRKGSRGKENPDQGPNARLRMDRETGELGGLLRIGKIKNAGKARVEVEAETGYSRSHGEGGTLVLEKVQGKWKVVRLKGWGFAYGQRLGPRRFVALVCCDLKN